MIDGTDFPHGKGILSWEGGERRSRRYGSFHLEPVDYGRTALVEASLSVPESLVGKSVRAVLRVVESRDSGHAGDHFINILPSRPAVGEVIVLGPGVLSVHRVEGMDTVGLFLDPEDGRHEFLLDPRLLYRLHDQTVELRLEETDEVADPVVLACAPDGVIANGDGSFQFSGSAHLAACGPPAGMKGAFVMSYSLSRGERVEAE